MEFENVRIVYEIWKGKNYGMNEKKSCDVKDCTKCSLLLKLEDAFRGV